MSNDTHMLHGVHGVDTTNVYVLLVSFALAHLKNLILIQLSLHLALLALHDFIVLFFYSILDPSSSILNHRSWGSRKLSLVSILDARSSIPDPRSSILDPRSSILVFLETQTQSYQSINHLYWPTNEIHKVITLKHFLS